jgi:MtN3 and saliva related transmembrane protein
MDGLWIDVLGVAGAVLSTISLMPQVVHTWRTRSAADISAAWLVMALVSTVIWMVYGNLIGARAVIWTNAICFAQCAYILFIKLQIARVTAAEQS